MDIRDNILSAFFGFLLGALVLSDVGTCIHEREVFDDLVREHHCKVQQISGHKWVCQTPDGTIHPMHP